MRIKYRLELLVVYACVATFSIVFYGGIIWVLVKLIREIRGF